MDTIFLIDVFMPNQTSDLSQGESAYARLLDAITQGDYAPGDRLREVEISERLSLSRTPVREALRKLEADGIVEHRARIGAVIRVLSHTEVVELYEMRVVLERTAAEMAAKHAAEAEIAELEEINAAIAAAKSPNEAATLNQHFHRCIYLSTRNRFLLESARALNNALLLLRPTTLVDDTRIQVVTRQHNDIIDAIRQGDAEAAGASAEAHLQTSLRHRLKVMRG